ncbi:hypothetical protein [Spirosoma agri]|uniref:Uncharacterized protein n=1 Tax=Spirosoma agri TaxID=1987381 RepID=A0A6M0IJL3_9BACT|nr:hypothetical protein [Spirosoma agri]NEU68037.1 hypothetical protein [Spirosoma agri]
MFSQKKCPHWLLLAVGTLLSQLPLLAQTDHASSTAHSGHPDSTGAYWKLKTDYKTRTTGIQFFNTQHQLIYEEKLPGRYVKLTKRTVRVFDELLDGLANRRLLDPQIESHDLLANNPAQFARHSKTSAHIAGTIANSPDLNESVFTANSAVTDLGKLILYCTNPDKVPVYVTLSSEDQQTDFFNERSKAVDYTRYFDINQLPAGTYRLNIKHPKKLFRFMLTINRKGERFSMVNVK